MSHTDTVREIYAAFGEGKIETILERIADDVDWEYPETSTSVPWLQHREGRESVGGFFASLAALEFTKFVPHTILEGGDVVISLLDVEFTVRETGERITETDEVHVFRFDGDGKVSKFKHGIDTHRHQLAVDRLNGRSDQDPR